MVRQMLGKLIGRTAGFSLWGEAASAEDALEKVASGAPDLVLADVSLPGMDGIELIRALHAAYPDLLMLAISGHDESMYAVSALRAGARGYVLKGKLSSVADALRQVNSGDIYASDIVRAILEDHD